MKINMFAVLDQSRFEMRWRAAMNRTAHPPRPVHPSRGDQQQAASEPMLWLTHCRAAVSAIITSMIHVIYGQLGVAAEHGDGL